MWASIFFVFWGISVGAVDSGTESLATNATDKQKQKKRRACYGDVDAVVGVARVSQQESSCLHDVENQVQQNIVGVLFR